jgi:hypothetical protein
MPTSTPPRGRRPPTPLTTSAWPGSSSARTDTLSAWGKRRITAGGMKDHRGGTKDAREGTKDPRGGTTSTWAPTSSARVRTTIPSSDPPAACAGARARIDVRVNRATRSVTHRTQTRGSARTYLVRGLPEGRVIRDTAAADPPEWAPSRCSGLEALFAPQPAERTRPRRRPADSAPRARHGSGRGCRP